MKISRSYKIKNVNWNALPDLKSRLAGLGVVVESASVELSRYPDTVGYDSIEDATKDVRENGLPRAFNVWVRGLLKDQSLTLTISRGRNIHDQQ